MTEGMDWQSAFNVLVILCGAMGGWILGRVTKTLDQLDRDIRNMPEKYVLKSDYSDDMHDIKRLLTRIEEKLDGKVDK